MAKSNPHIRMYGDIAVASIEPLPQELIPDYNSLTSGEAFVNGWVDAHIFASVRRAIKGVDRRGHLFGELDINGSIDRTLLLKNGQEVSIPKDSDTLYMDEEHVVVGPQYRFDNFSKCEPLISTEFRAFALIPYRYGKTHTFARSLRHAEPYSKSSWKRYAGIHLGDPWRRSR